MPPSRRVRRPSIEGYEETTLDAGWEMAATEPDACTEPGGLERSDLRWIAARVPGTAAGALRDSEVRLEGDERDLDAEDWWFRTRFTASPPRDGEEAILRLDGIATVAEVFLNDERVLRSESMFASHAIDVGHLLQAENELTIRCLALAPLLSERRKPRARWRTRLVAQGNLRFFRTMLLGRAPGFAPGPAVVGPWRGVSLERRRRLVLGKLRLLAEMAGGDGVLTASVEGRMLGGLAPSVVELVLDGPTGTHRAELTLGATPGGMRAEGRLTVPDATPWWPHTHGDPALYRARLIFDGPAGPIPVEAGRVGFRSLAPGPEGGHGVLRDGLSLHVNGVPVFCRGAVWTPVDPIGMAPSEEELRAALEAARDTGMNMVRLAGTGAYESVVFHDLCDELGILVWQDFMFANLDYPISEEAFRAAVEAEANQVLDELAHRPSLAVLCGNSEVEQQASMFGVDPGLGRGVLFGELLPSIVEARRPGAIYVPSSPSGGDLPFRTDAGVANYYGVGGYRRPLEDARRSAVRFAAECLAFANVPSEAIAGALLTEDRGLGFGPAWKAGVPRDVGADWDFEDVRDHYLGLLFDLDPTTLRDADPERYLELSRAVSGEVMSEVFGEWRRRGSPCAGGLVLWMRDLVPGAGWGLIDSGGEPKVALHHLRRALAPVAVWSTDEGLGGVVAHVANDRPEPLAARLRIGLYRDRELLVGDATADLDLRAHSGCEYNVEAMLGRFVDAAYAYRFGPPSHDVVVASLERDRGDETELLSQSFRFPAGRPTEAERAESLGLEADAQAGGDGSVVLDVSTRRLAYGLRIHAPGFRPDDDALSVEPGGRRRVLLRPQQAGVRFEGAALTALNLEGRLEVEPAGDPA